MALPTSSSTRTLSPRQKLIREVRLTLGEVMIKLELTPDHYEMAFDLALDRYRVRSSNAVEERISVLQLTENQNEYYLPEEIVEVRQVLRRGITGTSNGTGANFDPFSAIFSGLFAFGGTGIGAGPLAGGVAGDLITYELTKEYQTMLGRMFGAQLDFQWNAANHRLSLQRYINSSETVLLLVYAFRPDDELLRDEFARTWLRDYTIAKCKVFIGEAREKFGSIPSPQGGMTLNGTALKQEGVAELERLENEVKTQVDQSMGYPFTWG